MITKKQKQLIKKLKSFGYGWRKFAESVEQSGSCSEKQEGTMRNMLSRVTNQRALVEYRRNNKDVRKGLDYGDDYGCSDHEAMRSGDFF